MLGYLLEDRYRNVRTNLSTKTTRRRSRISDYESAETRDVILNSTFLLTLFSVRTRFCEGARTNQRGNFYVSNCVVFHQNSIREEIKNRLKSGNACYHSVQNLLSSSLLSKNIKIKIYRTTILPVVLYGCETWSLTLREERRMRVFENRVSRRIFGHKRDEVTGEWRKLHNEKLDDLYCSPNIVRVM